MDSLGLRLVRSLIQEKRIDLVTEQGLTATDLFDVARTAFDWTNEFVAKSHEWPTAAIVEENVGISFALDIDPLWYAIDLVRKRSLSKRLEIELKASVDLLESRDPDAVVSRLLEAGMRLKKHTTGTKLVSYRSSAPDRIADYDRLKIATTFDGIRTRWPAINKSIQGWMQTTLNVITAKQNTGKAQPVDTNVLTPTGYRRIGDLKIGDLVASVDGTFTKVNGVFPQGAKDTCEIEFSDGSKTEACVDHIWKIRNGTNKNWELKSTWQLQAIKYDRCRIPMVEPVQFPTKKVLLDPYLMGAILGDGGITGHSLSITNTDKFIIEKVDNLCALVGARLKRRPDESITYDIVGDFRRENDVLVALRRYGLKGKKSTEKWIPNDYKYGSVSQRVAILQGLLDTDGSAGKNNTIEFGVSSEQLFDDVRFIVHSLGGTMGKAYRSKTSSWRGCIVLPPDIDPFQMPRKRRIYRSRTKKRGPHRILKNILNVGRKECVCISVEHSSRLYLTTDCIVTHNTWISCIVADDCLKADKKVLFVTMEMPEGRIKRRLDAVRYKIPFGLLRDATMDTITEERWKAMLLKDMTLSTKGDILLADKRLVQKVSDVRALVIQHRPDVVIIDGGYRFKGSSRRDNMWADTVEIVSDLQDAAELSNIPWIVTTQHGDANDTGKVARKGPKMTAWNVRYGKEWLINPDVVIGLYADTDLRLLRQAELYPLKIREGVGEHVESIRIYWDTDNMNFDEVLSDRPTDEFIPVGDSDVVAY